MDSDILNFVTTEEGGPSTYFAVTYVVQKPSIDLLEKALVKLKADAPNTLFTDRLDKRISSIGALEIGGLAPDIELLSPDWRKD